MAGLRIANGGWWDNADMKSAVPISIVLALLMLITINARTPQSRGNRPSASPTAPQTDESTLPPGNIAHGRYLAEHVAMCVECHSGRDAQGNIIDSELFLGGPIPFAPPWPNDWANRAPRNRGLPGYTDEQALRLLTEGAIGRDGKQLRPPMPRFHMTTQDAADVIAFLRSLP
jgi:mono/diheme cytochrome c family protein